MIALMIVNVLHLLIANLLILYFVFCLKGAWQTVKRQLNLKHKVASSPNCMRNLHGFTNINETAYI